MPTCKICGLQLSRNFCLKRHEKSHSTNEQYPCVDCHKVYARFDNLQKHKSRCHGRAGQRIDGQPNQLIAPSLVDQNWSSLRESRMSCSSTTPSYSKSIVNPSRCQQSTVVDDINDGRNRESAEEPAESQEQSIQMFDGRPSYTASGSIAMNVLANPSLPEAQPASPFTITTPTGVSDSSDGEQEGCDANRIGTFGVEKESQPPLPAFAVDIVQHLQEKYRNAELVGIMHFKRSQMPVRASSMYLLATTSNGDREFQPQFVPVIRCLDCPSQELFEISPFQPFQDMRVIKEHLNRSDHCLVRSKRKRESWVAAHGGSSFPSIHQLEHNFGALEKQKLLILAVKTQDVKVLSRLLKDVRTVHEKEKGDRTALHWACELGRQEMAELLIRFGANLDDRDDQEQTPLDLALKVGLDFAMKLVRVLAEVRQNESKFANDTPLVLACRLNRLSVVEGLVEDGADVNETTINFPLAIAVRHASWEVVRYLLSKGAYPQVVDMFHLRRLAEKKAGTHVGSDYQDAAEKIRLLKRHGLKFWRKTKARLPPWYY